MSLMQLIGWPWHHMAPHPPSLSFVGWMLYPQLHTQVSLKNVILLSIAYFDAMVTDAVLYLRHLPCYAKCRTCNV